MGSVASIDLSLPNIWRAWYAFRRGKKRTIELDSFGYSLEANLLKLHRDLILGTYQHGSYKTFEITDSKRRTISVASIRDRVVHRLLYDYLTKIFDKSFIYDAWSCRKGKGLLGAIIRTQNALKKYKHAYVWRSDITKFFDSVDQNVLQMKIRRKVHDEKTLHLIDMVITSYSSSALGKGMPIGNLTSQIFTNIYLHELDWHISQYIKPLSYVRYGDDFILILDNLATLKHYQEYLTIFIDQELKLTVHSTNNVLIPVRRGIHFLGCDIYPTGRRLRKKMLVKIKENLNFTNSASYRSLALTHSKRNIVKWIDWNIIDLLDQL